MEVSSLRYGFVYEAGAHEDVGRCEHAVHGATAAELVEL